MVTLDEANKIMGKFNETFDIIRKKKDEFDKKRIRSRDARLIFEGLRFCYIEVCYLSYELDVLLGGKKEEKE